MNNKMEHPASSSNDRMQAVNCVAMLLLVALTNLTEAEPLDTWTVQNGVPPDNPLLKGLSSIAYGNGRFVAVGDGAILTSADGAHWVQPQSLPESGLHNLDVVIYANGVFWVAGSNADSSDFIETSTDGVTWTSLPNLEGDRVGGIAYGNGRFVAVTDSSILSSADGMNWTDEGNPAGYAYELTSVCYGNGHFVVFTYGKNCDADACPAISLSSVNGADWVQGSPGTTSWLTGIYANGQFVTVGLPDGTILTSADGINWVQRDSGITYPLSGIAYGDGQFVAVGKASTVVTSRDGTNWVKRLTGSVSLGYLSGIAYGQGQFVAIGSGLLTSTDGLYWLQRQSEKLGGGIAYGNGQFVALGYDDGGDGAMVTSSNGLNWSWQSSGTWPPLTAITYASGLFVAVGGQWEPPPHDTNFESRIVTSADGLTWVERQTMPGVWLNAIAFGNGLFVAVGDKQTPSGVLWPLLYSRA